MTSQHLELTLFCDVTIAWPKISQNYCSNKVSVSVGQPFTLTFRNTVENIFLFSYFSASHLVWNRALNKQLTARTRFSTQPYWIFCLPILYCEIFTCTHDRTFTDWLLTMCCMGVALPDCMHFCKHWESISRQSHHQWHHSNPQLKLQNILCIVHCQIITSFCEVSH